MYDNNNNNFFEKTINQTMNLMLNNRNDQY